MGERNFIIVPAGTVKTKLMNTKSFLCCVVAFTVLLLGGFKATFLTLKSHIQRAQCGCHHFRVLPGSQLSAAQAAQCLFELKHCMHAEKVAHDSL